VLSASSLGGLSFVVFFVSLFAQTNLHTAIERFEVTAQCDDWASKYYCNWVDIVQQHLHNSLVLLFLFFKSAVSARLTACLLVCPTGDSSLGVMLRIFSGSLSSRKAPNAPTIKSKRNNNTYILFILTNKS